MNPGDLLRPRYMRSFMYDSIDFSTRGVIGVIPRGSSVLALDARFSPSDVYYIRVLSEGVLGWVRAETLEVVE